MKKFIFIGEKPEKSSPLLTWSNAIQRTGNNTEFIEDLGKLSTKEFINKVKHSDAVVYQGYKDITTYEIRQLCLAPILGVPLIRKWSGSDVLYCQKFKDTYQHSKLLDKIVTKNLSSETPSLIEELNELGINCDLIKPILNKRLNIQHSSSNNILPKKVLIYLPDGRESFYGYEKIVPLIEKFKDLQFLIIANKNNILSNYPNVTNLGWITDMDAVWDQIGCLIRLTEHDGISRMVCEALARGKYIIFSQKLEGCWHAKNTEEADFFITKFKNSQNINFSAINAAQKLLTSKNDTELKENILSCRINRFSKEKLEYILIFFKLYLKNILQNNR